MISLRRHEMYKAGGPNSNSIETRRFTGENHVNTEAKIGINISNDMSILEGLLLIFIS